MIWFQKYDLETINRLNDGCAVSHLGIVVTEIGDNFVEATMPVDEKTKQPYGLLHGGSSCMLIETLGSVAAHMTVDPKTQMAVGIEINANHVRSAKSGLVKGRAESIHIGKSTQVWDVRISDEQGKLTCVGRLTVAIIRKI